MRIRHLHDWDLTPTAAIALQRQLAARVISNTPLEKIKLIAGADVSYNRFQPTLYAGVVVLRADDLSVVERAGVVADTPFPYIPGLLSFREAPIVLQAFARLKRRPDVVMYDGQGIAHPRRLGIASHLGLWLDRPCVGCAKSLFVGEHEPLAREAGASAELIHKGDVIGAALRTKDGVKPVYVSVGHRIDLASAIRLVLQCRGGYRVPEPTRQAHLFVNELRLGAARC